MKDSTRTCSNGMSSTVNSLSAWGTLVLWLVGFHNSREVTSDISLDGMHTVTNGKLRAVPACCDELVMNIIP